MALIGTIYRTVLVETHEYGNVVQNAFHVALVEALESTIFCSALWNNSQFY